MILVVAFTFLLLLSNYKEQITAQYEYPNLPIKLVQTVVASKAQKTK